MDKDSTRRFFVLGLGAVCVFAFETGEKDGREGRDASLYTSKEGLLAQTLQALHWEESFGTAYAIVVREVGISAPIVGSLRILRCHSGVKTHFYSFRSLVGLRS